MSPDNIAAALTFVVVLVANLVAHNVADHWMQTHDQAVRKGLQGWTGRLACLRHVASYIFFTALVTGAMWALFGLQISPFSFVAGQLISAVTHYWADRRTTLQWLAELLRKGDLFHFGAPRVGKDDNPSLGSGAYALDQAWHWLWILVASIVTAILA